MSRDMNEARRMFHDRLKEATDNTVYGTVEKVDENARTCDVKVGGVVYEGVLLYAIEKAGLKGMTLIPAKGSGVLLSRVGSSNRRLVEMFSEVDKVLLTIGENLDLVIDAGGMHLKAAGTTLKATTGGITITRGNSGLKKTLGSLCDELAKLTVFTNSGRSGIPVNAAKFKAIKNELNDYLEG